MYTKKKYSVYESLYVNGHFCDSISVKFRSYKKAYAFVVDHKALMIRAYKNEPSFIVLSDKRNNFECSYVYDDVLYVRLIKLVITKW